MGVSSAVSFSHTLEPVGGVDTHDQRCVTWKYILQHTLYTSTMFECTNRPESISNNLESTVAIKKRVPKVSV
jgi:hypothetical protein